LFKSDVGGILGATAVVGLCLIVVNVIPYLGALTGIVFSGPLLGGLFLFYLKQLRREGATMSDAFSGFGPRFGQMLLAIHPRPAGRPGVDPPLSSWPSFLS